MFVGYLLEGFLLFLEDIFKLRDLGVGAVHFISHKVVLVDQDYLHLFLVLPSFGDKEKTLVEGYYVCCQGSDVHLLVTVEISCDFKTVLLLKLC